MNYYLYHPDANNFAGMNVEEADRSRVVQVYYQTDSLASGWTSIRLHPCEDTPIPQGDFPSLSDFRRLPVVSERAWDILKPIVGSRCEALSIRVDTPFTYFLLHVTEVVDCVDTCKSVLRHYSDGAVMRIDRYCIDGRVAKGKHLLRLPRQIGGEMLLDDVFRDVVEKNDLHGLIFRPISRV